MCTMFVSSGGKRESAGFVLRYTFRTMDILFVARLPLPSNLSEAFMGFSYVSIFIPGVLCRKACS